MRSVVTFRCEGAALAGTLDEGPRSSGLLIVSGGNEIRIGAHRGMAELANAVSKQGHPVFRFDRRGVGDSEGENGGFRSSGPDIAAALAAFRKACPHLARIVGFGNCDAATALVLHDSAVEARVLANPWITEPTDALPPPAAIRGRYARRVRDPAAWAALLTGKIDLRAAAKGLGRIASPIRSSHSLAESVGGNITGRATVIVLAERDNTAVAFAEAWKRDCFATARATIPVRTIDSAFHSFASDEDFAALTSVLLETLGT